MTAQLVTRPKHHSISVCDLRRSCKSDVSINTVMDKLSLQDTPLDSHQPQPRNICTFHHSLQQLRMQLDDMNKRTATLLHRHKQDQSALQQQGGMFSPSETLTLPNGPAFWQLYRALRSDIRGLDARVELIEDHIENLSDRIDALEPHRFTPPASPAFSTCKHDGDPKIADLPKAVPDLRATNVPNAEVSDIGYFDPSCRNDLTQHSTTSDIVTFLAKLSRTSRTKRIVNPEQFLRGAALHLYRLGYKTTGDNVYELEDGRLDLKAFEEVFLPVFKPQALNLMKSETYTLADLHSGRRLVEDYALKMFDLARYLDGDDSDEKRKFVHDLIQDGIRLARPAGIRNNEWVTGDTFLEHMIRLRNLESALRREMKEPCAPQGRLYGSNQTLDAAAHSNHPVSGNSWEAEAAGEKENFSMLHCWRNVNDPSAPELPGTPVHSSLRPTLSHTRDERPDAWNEKAKAQAAWRMKLNAMEAHGEMVKACPSPQTARNDKTDYPTISEQARCASESEFDSTERSGSVDESNSVITESSTAAGITQAQPSYPSSLTCRPVRVYTGAARASGLATSAPYAPWSTPHPPSDESKVLSSNHTRVCQQFAQANQSLSDARDGNVEERNAYMELNVADNRFFNKLQGEIDELRGEAKKQLKLGEGLANHFARMECDSMKGHVRTAGMGRQVEVKLPRTPKSPLRHFPSMPTYSRPAEAVSSIDRFQAYVESENGDALDRSTDYGSNPFDGLSTWY
ncbi:hypothetical protein BDV97DRAFT_346863 [Delphinella strobiligena]|nr:hypothetical protein BDV97DRAFT_346863 [Delphinella strobiligena]